MNSTRKKLFCIPYAGGSAMIFNRWKEHVNDNIDIINIELSGRGARFNEPLYDSFSDIIDDLSTIVINQIGDSEFAFFGHSLGGLLAYELSYIIKGKINRNPFHMFLSGVNAPMLKEEKTFLHLISNEELKDLIKKMGGTPDEILNNEKVFDVFLPIIRSDFKAYDTYRYSTKFDKLNCDISILNGDKDNCIDYLKLSTWKERTSKNCYFYKFIGGHFYFLENVDKVVNIINNTI
ncbi:thioesterase [Clostridium estertheticum]|nr:thioesterase domain-containing protein [Clostridium estertheticum]MBU3198548.1 thioesterase [Clostridium estertheticum]WAG64528.1 thioesterase [Clostridium estertheticum]